MQLKMATAKSSLKLFEHVGLSKFHELMGGAIF